MVSVSAAASVAVDTAVFIWCLTSGAISAALSRKELVKKVNGLNQALLIFAASGSTFIF